MGVSKLVIDTFDDCGMTREIIYLSRATNVKKVIRLLLAGAEKQTTITSFSHGVWDIHKTKAKKSRYDLG